MRNFTVGFAVSLVVVFWSGPESALIYSGLVAFALLAALIFTSPLRALLVGLMVGLVVAHATLLLQFSKQFGANETQRDYSVVGTVVSVPKLDSRRSSFVFRIDRFVDENISLNMQRIRLSWYGPESNRVRAGDQWQLLVRLKPITSLGNPGGFHYARWLFQNRIHATGYVRDKPAPKRLARHRWQLHALRQSLAQAIADLPGANDYSALVQGLTVGVTTQVLQEHWKTLRQSGTAHLLAISGLHIGLIGGWFYFLSGLIWRIWHCVSSRHANRFFIKPVFCLGGSCFGACIYAALAGFSLPTQRALIMLVVFALCASLRRIWPAGSALLVALLLVLILDPLTVLSVGFWLSFGTVLALFYLHQGHLSVRGKLHSAFLVHLKLGFVLLPATAWFFQQGAMLSPLANMIAVPVVGLLIVPLSFCTALFTSLWPVAANGLLLVVQWLLEQLMRLLDWLLQIPGSNVALFIPGTLELLFTFAALLLVFSPRGLRLRWLCVPLITPAILLNIVGKPVQGLEMHVLDVGQGLSVVLFTAKHTVLFDTGSRLSGDTTMLDRVVQPFLIAHGRPRIDIAVLSHADDDHAGGIDSLLELHPDTILYSSDEEHHQRFNARACQAGTSFKLAQVSFSFLHPARGDLGSRNNMSCVLLIHVGKSRVLLTGDIEAQSEALLVSRVGRPFPVDVLLAPHHGSRSSSTPDFITLFQPDTVIYAAGENNRFGFPHPQVVSRYEQIGAESLVTGQSGALSLYFDHTGVTHPTVQYWSNRRRYRR